MLWYCYKCVQAVQQLKRNQTTRLIKSCYQSLFKPFAFLKIYCSIVDRTVNL